MVSIFERIFGRMPKAFLITSRPRLRTRRSYVKDRFPELLQVRPMAVLIPGLGNLPDAIYKCKADAKVVTY